jgi:hypothetical protein
VDESKRLRDAGQIRDFDADTRTRPPRSAEPNYKHKEESDQFSAATPVVLPPLQCAAYLKPGADVFGRNCGERLANAHECAGTRGGAHTSSRGRVAAEVAACNGQSQFGGADGSTAANTAPELGLRICSRARSTSSGAAGPPIATRSYSPGAGSGRLIAAASGTDTTALVLPAGRSRHRPFSNAATLTRVYGAQRRVTPIRLDVNRGGARRPHPEHVAYVVVSGRQSHVDRATP